MTLSATDAVATLDVGGTTIKGAVGDHAGTVPVPAAPADAGPRPPPQRSWPPSWPRSRAGGAAPAGIAVRGVGLVVTGIVDERRGLAVHSENVGWRDVPIRSLVEQAAGLPVGFGHDVRAGALAEWRLGAGRGLDDLVFVPVGTGVSAGIVVQGRLLTGGGYAGEIGHLNVGHGEPCACGGRGCVEAVASPPRSPSVAGPPRRPVPTPGGRRGWSPATGRPAGLGRRPSRLALALAGPRRAGATAILLAASGPPASLLEPLRQGLDRHLGTVRRPRLLPAALQDEAGCLGAALLAWEVLGRQP